MNILLQMLIGASVSAFCPQPASVVRFETAGLPAESAEVCFTRGPKPWPAMNVV